MFERTVSAYFNAKVLRMVKVEPPVRVIGWGATRQVIFLENPFPDWTGVWTERAGRSLMIETKSTCEPRLAMKEKGALSANQIDWLKRWHVEGAAVGVVWEWMNHGCVFLPIGKVWQIWQSGRRHIKFDECDPVLQGTGMILIDFAANLRRWYP